MSILSFYGSGWRCCTSCETADLPGASSSAGVADTLLCCPTVPGEPCVCADVQTELTLTPSLEREFTYLVIHAVAQQYTPAFYSELGTTPTPYCAILHLRTKELRFPME